MTEKIGNIKIKILRSWNDLLESEMIWNEILRCSDYNSIFLTFEWFSTFIKRFRIKNLAIIVLYIENESVGILPLFVDSLNFHGFKFKILKSITNVHTPKYNFIFKSGYDQYIFNALLLLQKVLKWDLIQIEFVSDKTYLIRSFSHNTRTVDIKKDFMLKSPYILCNEDFNTYYNSLSKKFRKELEYKWRRAGKNYDSESECINGKQLNSDILKEAFIIEDSGWKGKNKSSILKNPSFLKFYRDLAIKMNHNGWFDLNFLKFSGKRIAFRYCLKYNSVYSSLKTGYDETYRKYSPGMILTKTTTENVFKAKYSKFDMLGQADGFKVRIANGYDDIFRLYFFNKRTKSRILKFIHFDSIELLEKLRLKTFLKTIYLKIRRI